MENARNTGKRLLSGVALLTVSTLTVKVLGFLYKIPMLSALGEEGMGYFHSAFEVYAFIGNIAAAGIPAVLSVLIARAIAKGEENTAAQLFRSAVKILFLFGTAGSFATFFGAEIICGWLSNPGAAGCMRAVAPGILTLCLSTVLRGYHQGYGRMLPTALSQVFEALGKAVFGLLFVRIAINRGDGVQKLAEAAGFGLSLGNLVSFLLLLLIGGKAVFKKPIPSAKKTASGLLRLSVPLVAGTALTGLSRIVEIGLIMSRLQAAGYSSNEANLLLGGFTTMSLSVFALIPTLVSGIATPLLPLLAGESAKETGGKSEELISLSFGLTAFFAIPASFGIAAYAEEILTFLFPNALEAASRAAPTLALLGASVLPSCLVASVTSVLQAHRKTKEPFLALGAGILVKTLLSFFLLGKTSVALSGIPIGTFVCDLTVVCFDLYFARDELPDLSPAGIFLKPTLCGFLAVGSVSLSVKIGIQAPSFPLQLAEIAGLYLATYLLLDVVLMFFTNKYAKKPLVLVFFLKKVHKK